MKLSKPRRFLLFSAIFILFLVPSSANAAPVEQENTPEVLAADKLSRLTAEEKVGQLFLIEFEGSRVEEDGELYDLISNYHIGGVVLKRENNNIDDSGDFLLNAWLLVQEIQRAEISTSRTRQVNPETGNSFSPALIPLFVAISQDGDGYPEDQILSGLTPLPNAMALGATWNPDLAFSTGEILGDELSALGINMLLGPSLNINSNPSPESGGDLGTTSFGGSSYWVGEMGAQYVAGLHAGSDGQIVVISKDFPGISGTDRPTAEEIPTVRRTLEQLIEFEFEPFFAVTGQAVAEMSITDGVLLSHAKFQAFQSNVTTATPPITLDSQALDQLMSVSDFSSWYDQGGLILSDDLWSQAIQRYYEQQAAEFRPTLIARDALLAGNDILVLSGLQSYSGLDHYETVRATLDFFAQKYRDDLAFAQQVDEAVLRILTAKYEIYPAFDSETILPSSTRLMDIGNSSDVTFEIARQSATLIDPSRENLTNVLPGAPSATDEIVIITDGYTYSQCDTCEENEYPGVTTFQQEVLRLYGEEGDGLISMWNISSFSVESLISALDSNQEEEPSIITQIRRARWVVFLFLGTDPERPETMALERFLSEMPDLIQDKKTVVFSFTAPYYLDATTISQVTAYYGLYSKQPQFFEIAARLLFQELSPSGSSPVSISGAGYLLGEVLLPDTSQTISLQAVPTNQSQEEDALETPAPDVYPQGATVLMETSEILDFNGNIVADNTLVTFSLVSTGSGGAVSQRDVSAYTVDGVAQTSYLLDTAGILEAAASISDGAVVSNTLRLEVIPGGEAANGGSAELPTQTDQATQAVSEEEEEELPRDATSLVDWLISSIVIGFIGLFTFQMGVVSGNIRWAVRWALTSLIGGLAANAYLSFGLPGSADLILEYGIWGIVICIASGCLTGWGAGLIWRSVAQRRK